MAVSGAKIVYGSIHCQNGRQKENKKDGIDDIRPKESKFLMNDTWPD